MTENKRYYRTNVNLEDNNHEPYYNIRDRKKEGNNVLFMVGGKYTSKEIVDRLNEQEERIKQLEKDVLDLQAEIGRLNCKKEIEKPHWLKYETSQGYTRQVNQDIRFKGDVDD